MCMKEQKPPKVRYRGSFPPAPSPLHSWSRAGSRAGGAAARPGTGTRALELLSAITAVPESRNCLTPPSIIHLGKNTKANHSTQDLDALKILPAECRGTAANGNLLSVTCVLTGILLDKASPEMLGMVLVTLCRQSRAEVEVTRLGFWLPRSTAVKDTLGVVLLVLDTTGLLGH